MEKNNKAKYNKIFDVRERKKGWKGVKEMVEKGDLHVSS